MNSELLRSGLPPDLAMPLVDPPPLVPQAASSGPPKPSPTAARPVPLTKSRLDGLKTLMTCPLLSMAPHRGRGGRPPQLLLSPPAPHDSRTTRRAGISM